MSETPAGHAVAGAPSADRITPESTGPVSEKNSTVTHDIPMSTELRAAIAEDWDPAPVMPHPARADGAPYSAKRRSALSALFRGQLVVVPSGVLKTRANDTEYAFRASSSFAWLTGETIEDAVLLLVPAGSGHEQILYVREYVPPGDLGYFTNRLHGALWVGNVPTVGDTAAALGVTTRPLADLPGDLERWRSAEAAVLTGLDPTVDGLLPRGERATLGRVLDELRLVKDDWEVDRLRDACEATTRGFADVVRELPALLATGGDRGERWLEGTFWRRARYEGNEPGYTSIVGAGRHGTTLHWWRNDGAITDGQLLLADMGVETRELYTADVTRTLPVNGSWTADQLRVYRAVLAAQDAGLAELKAGNDFAAGHRAAMWVLADHLHAWGVLPVPAEVSCAEDVERPGAGLHRRYTLHGTSHMLGIDVHDCALARTETYTRGQLAAGEVLTMEPGLYFQPNDRTVPVELRGMAVRIEDDILVTNGDPVNLSASLPRDPDEVAEWMREVQGTPTAP